MSSNQVEYAVSSRSSCKYCGRSINQDDVRIGKETKSEHHDGWDLSWYAYFKFLVVFIITSHANKYKNKEKSTRHTF